MQQPLQIGMGSVLVLILLLLAVPLQLFFSTRTKTAEGKDSREEAMNSLRVTINSVVSKGQSWLPYFTSWDRFKELFLIRSKRKTSSSSSTVFQSSLGKGVTYIKVSRKNAEESEKRPEAPSPREPAPAKDAVVNFHEGGLLHSPSVDKEVTQRSVPSNEHFAQSEVPRNSRLPEVHYRIGQVVRHKNDQYVGVIVGWDSEAKTPEEWIHMHYSARREYLRHTPHYLVLVDSHYDASAAPFRYIPQEDLELVEETKVQSSELSKYFEGYSNGHYQPKPWLQTRYPKD